MKIGLFVKSYSSLFTNGCAQQCYFLLKSLRKSNHEVNFITIQDDYKKYEIIDENIYNVCDVDTLKSYNIVIFTSLIVDQYKLLNHIKLLGIKIANLIVGNYYVINCEEFVFNVHNNVMKDMNNEYVDEIWLMPMYNHAKNYIQYITKKPVVISPYVWDSEIIDKYISQNSLKLEYDFKEDNVKDKKGLDILIMEPNLSIHKNALPALVILNYYFINYPSRINAIHLLSKPKHDNYLESISHFEIYKANKIISYPRIVSLDFFSKLIKQNKKFLILSTNIRNGLNFLHLECFSLNIPIIHNCPLYKDNGLYYEDSDSKTEYFKVISYLNKAWENPSNIQDKEKCKEILQKFDSIENINIEKYDLISRNLLKKYKPSIFEINKIINMNNKSKNNILNEFGVIIPTSNSNNNYLISKNLETLSKKTNKYWNVNIYSSYEFQLKNEYKNLKINIFKNLDKKNIEIYSLSQNNYKYNLFINEFTICYIDLNDIENIFINNKEHILVGGCKYNFELEKEDYNKKIDYLTKLYKSFDLKYEYLLDKNLFFYRNSSLIMNLFNNVYLNYDRFKNLLEKNFEIPFLFDLVCKKKINISSERKIVTNTKQEPIGYCFTSSNTLIFITFDDLLLYDNDIKILISKYSKSIKYLIKKKIFRKISFKDNFQYLQI